MSTNPLVPSSSASSDVQPILYSYWRSSCSWRVRIAMNLKEIPYDIKPISLIKSGGEQHCNEYREVNPMEQVPALQIGELVNWTSSYPRHHMYSPLDGHTLIESVAIMHYLEETRPQRPLLPQDVHKRAKVREIVEIICSGIQPLQNLIVLIHVGEEKKKEWAQHWITRGFRAVEKALSTSAGKYCVGDEISMADCCLVPQVFNARRFHVDLRPYPIILRIDRELESNPAFRAAHPSNQPDCPPELPNK
ncbi:hypothetical protein KR038_009365 [Drosophila bunnanda]|nr:hypothetical protein KR038_009365 [Drosophila bunnanda]